MKIEIKISKEKIGIKEFDLMVLCDGTIKRIEKPEDRQQAIAANKEMQQNLNEIMRG